MNDTLKAAFELGYRSCEKGMNPQAALEYFNQVQGVQPQIVEAALPELG